MFEWVERAAGTVGVTSTTTMIVLVLVFILVLVLALSGVTWRDLLGVSSAYRLLVDELDMKRGGSSHRRRHKRGAQADVIYKDLKRHPRSRSEADVIKQLEDILGVEFPTALPAWLTWGPKRSRLELDGYNEERRIALEFSGPLHTKWTPTIEPYEHYYERIVRDVVKRRLCARNGVHLIVVDMRMPRHQQRNYLLSRLYDIGAVPDRPANYIAEQDAPVFRNPQLERELGLGAEMAAAEAL